MTATQQGFPQISAPVVDPNTGQVTTTWLYLFKALWDRTGGGSGGAVNSVAVQANNGITSVVQNPTSDVMITLGLGAIDPSSVAASGTMTGSNLSGTNTGDQTIALTGDVTGSGTGTFAATLATVNPDVGSFSAANITVDGKGRITAAASGSSASAITALTGDVTASGPGSAAATLATVNADVGTYTAATVTVNAKGLVTAIVDGGGITATITTAALTGGGTQGSQTFTKGVLVAQTPAT